MTVFYTLLPHFREAPLYLEIWWLMEGRDKARICLVMHPRCALKNWGGGELGEPHHC